MSERCCFFLFPNSRNLSSVSVVQCSSGANKVNCLLFLKADEDLDLTIFIRDRRHCSVSLTSSWAVRKLDVQSHLLQSRVCLKTHSLCGSLRQAWSGNCVPLWAFKRLLQTAS